MIEVDWKWLLTTAVIPACFVVYGWLTKTYWPAKQKQASDTATSTREFNKATEGSAFNQVLANERDLILHTIASANGLMAALAAAVASGNTAILSELRDVETKLGGLEAAFNKVLVLLSQQQAGHRLDDDLRAATIKSPEVKRADETVRAAGEEVQP